MKYFLVFLIFSFKLSFSQKSDSVTQTPSFFKGQLTATNNGVSLIPAFTLGKPALLFDLSMGKGRFSFDPMLRWNINSKPWAFIFWLRYKLIDNKKLKMSVGAHPSIIYRPLNVTENGKTTEYLSAQRYVAWEVVPTYFINKNIGVGLSYLGSKGLTKIEVPYTTYFALRAVMPHVGLSKNYSLMLAPQVFYLDMAGTDGTYASSIVGLNKKNFPFSLSSILSKKINSDLAGKDFVWNIQLNYNINNIYSRRGLGD